jgi:hypothetical protein
MGNDNRFIEAMCGICVGPPDTYIEHPSNLKQWASEVLGMNYENVKLSPKGKVEFMTLNGETSFEERLKDAEKMLPEEMQNYMEKHGLKSNSYEVLSFIEDLGSDMKILCMAATKKGKHPIRPATNENKKWWQIWK